MSELEKKTEQELDNILVYDEDENSDYFDQEGDEAAYNSQIIEHIVESSCGKAEDGHPKAAITLSIEMWSLKNNKARGTASYSSNKAVIGIQKHYDFIQIDMEFPSKIDNDLKVIWGHLERFGRTLDKINDKSIEVPFLSLTIVPVSENGGYYMVCTNPIFWCIQPQKPGLEANTLRLQFRSEDVGFFESDEIDMYEIEADVQRGLTEQERVEELYAQAEADKAEFLDKRNQQMEELRKNRENE